MVVVDLNYSHIFFMMLGFLPVLACVPCWVVAKFVYEPYVKKLVKEEKEPIPYEYQYPLMDVEPITNIDYKSCIVLSNTPKGLVYMRYCKEDEGFEYWADNSIDYKYLETVARKYVTIFSCQNIYIDRFTLLKEKILGIKQKIEENKLKEEKEDLEEKEDDVFASLKSYNKSSSSISSTKTKLTRNDVVCDEANKYLNRGKIVDANFSAEKKIVDTPTSSMSFSSWKLWKSQDKED
tara:strand:+ start:131 stop:838 length:708 start_codon:yes stop_codon:yes gene_type:complete